MKNNKRLNAERVAFGEKLVYVNDKNCGLREVLFTIYQTSRQLFNSFLRFKLHEIN